MHCIIYIRIDVHYWGAIDGEKSLSFLVACLFFLGMVVFVVYTVSQCDMCGWDSIKMIACTRQTPISLCKYWHDSAKTLWSFRHLGYLFYHSTWSKDVVALKLRPKMWIIAWQWTVNANERFKLITQGPTSRSVAVTSVNSTIWMMKKGTVQPTRWLYTCVTLMWHVPSPCVSF